MFALRVICVLFVSAACVFGAAAQTGASPAKPSTAQKNATTAPSSPVTPATADAQSKPEGPSIPSEYRSIALGSGMDAVKGQLLGDPLFGYRGERDVSLLPGENRTLIETAGGSFVKRAWFQFYEDKLYIMTLSLDSEKVDYYSLYTHFVEKYGEPTSLDPRKAVWTDDKTTMSLERPLTVKYTDAETFKKLLDADTTAKAASDVGREDFINGF